jgi:four helix bundle protein
MDHKKLDAWKLSVDLVTEVYKVTTTFPKNEEYGITSQIRRSVISVPSNISEGAGRDSKKEYVRF